MLMQTAIAWSLSCLVLETSAFCHGPVPAFTPPTLQPSLPQIQHASERIASALTRFAARQPYKQTSFSVGVTSSTETLFDFHHTASERNGSRPGAAQITADTAYRIASNTKAFTVLAILQLHASHALALDDPVIKHIPELGGPHSGTTAWSEITLRALASWQGGLPRDFVLEDLSSNPKTAAACGLPELDKSTQDVAQCDETVDWIRPCSHADLLSWLMTRKPVLSPNQKSTYANAAFDLLGLVIANVTGLSYEEYILQHILEPLKMTNTCFITPPESIAAIPNGPTGKMNYFGLDLGVNNPTGGLYSSTADMAKWIRFALTNHNNITNAMNWFAPLSWSGNVHSAYGMPWEIFRTDVKLRNGNGPTRDVTFVTKGGDWAGYKSKMILVPQYGIGIIILVAGNQSAAALLSEIVLSPLIDAADELAQEDLKARYVGRYVATKNTELNSSMTIDHEAHHVGTNVAAQGQHVSSSMTIGHSPQHGLVVQSWISDGVDVLNGLTDGLSDMHTFHVLPTMQYEDELTKTGDKWRIINLSNANTQDPLSQGILNDLCLTNYDAPAYGGRPVNEIVFWGSGNGEPVERLKLTGYRIELGRAQGKLSVQDEPR